MKLLRILLLLSVIFLSGIFNMSKAQTTLEWDSVYTINQPYCDGGFFDVISDNHGNVYLTGNMYGEPTCGGSTPPVCRLVKLDALGNIIWDVENTYYNGIVQYPLSGWGLSFDNDSNLYVYSGCGPTSTSAEQLHVAKYDTSGNLIWSNKYGFTYFDINNEADFKFRSDGKMIICSNTAGGKTLMIDTAGVLTNLSWPGYEYRGFDIDDNDNLYRIANSTSLTYYYFSKINSNGVQQFNIPASNNVYLSSVDVIDNNHIAVYGDSAGAGGIHKIYMYDSSGTLHWQRNVTSANSFFGADNSGEIWCVGQDFPSPEFSKYDTLGNLLFTKTIVFPANSVNLTLSSGKFQIDNYNNLHFINYTFGGPSFAAIMKITENGVLVYYHEYDYGTAAAIDWESFSGMNIDFEGNIYLACELTTFPVVSTYQLVVKYSKPPEEVWPGDADYNLEANNIDILELGLNYGNAGSLRPNASLTWAAQPSPDWSLFSPSGLNSKHADCNGDGQVNHSDTMAISLNYGLTHPFRLMQNESTSLAVGPEFYIEPPVGPIYPGSIVTVPIKLGTASNPAIDFYGIAYRLGYDQSKIEANSISIDFSGSWIGQDPAVVNFAKNFPANGQVHFAQVSTLHNNLTGQGTIAELTFQVKPTASGAIYMNLGSINAINNLKDKITVNYTPVVLTTGLSDVPDPGHFSIFHNPSDNQIYIQSLYNKAEIKEVVVLNLAGQQTTKVMEFDQSLTMDASSLSSGIYIAQITGSNKRVLRSKFIINR